MADYSTKNILVPIMMGIALAACGPVGPVAPPRTAQPTITPGPAIVAVVNGQPISMETFSRELARYEAGRASLGMEPASPQDKQHILDELIKDELIRQLAASQGIIVTDEQVTAEINLDVQQYGQEYVDSWVYASGWTPEEYREFIRLELIKEQLVQPIIASVPMVTDHIHARHILVSRQEDAEQVLARLQAGEDFAALAAEYSVDVTNKSNGGDLGWFPRGGLLVPEIEEAAFSLPPGQTSGIIVTACCGYDIVQTLEIAQREMDSTTRSRLIGKAIQAWRDGLTAGADIQQFISFN